MRTVGRASYRVLLTDHLWGSILLGGTSLDLRSWSFGSSGTVRIGFRDQIPNTVLSVWEKEPSRSR